MGNVCRTTAVVLFVANILLAFVLLMQSGFIIFLALLVSGFVSFLSLFSLGTIIENTEELNSNIFELHRMLRKIGKEIVPEEKSGQSTPTGKNTTARKTENGMWICKKCSAENDSLAQFCKECGEYK